MAGESRLVLVWWTGLGVVSVLNACAWAIVSRRALREAGSQAPERRRALRWQIALSALFVAGCAFRSFLPRAEGQRICLYDASISSATISRTVATIAELALIAQWSLALGTWARDQVARNVARIAAFLVPLIAAAEVCSWYTTLTTNFLGSVIEESIWATTAALVGIALILLSRRASGGGRRLFGIGVALLFLYVLYMCTNDVPMYWSRWRRDEAHNLQYLSVGAGLVDASVRSIVTRRWDDWRDEIPWMTFYFSTGVWISIGLILSPFLPKAGIRSEPTRWIARPRASTAS